VTDTSYEPYSREPEYVELNRAFVRSLTFDGARTVLDLACGTGSLADEILEVHPRLRVLGVDISRESLLLARDHFAAPEGAGRRVVLVEASADRLPLAGGSVDAVVMGNAIHTLPDLKRLLLETRRVLRPGGAFSFSTSFYAGTFAPGTESFYLQWMKEALRRIAPPAGNGGERAGRPPRIRGTVPRASSKPWLSSEEYGGVLGTCGFTVASVFQREVAMSCRSFELVGAYSGLARVLLSGYPVEQACEALSRSAAAALAACQRTVVPRRWLEMTAVAC
jgi:SAM-dependent methyltransferase